MTQLLLAYARLLLSLIVIGVVHEAGHALAARRLGVPIRRLRIGTGPVVARFVWSHVPVMVCLLPVCACIAIDARRTLDGSPRRPLEVDAAILAGGLGASMALACVAGILNQVVPSPWLLTTANLSLIVMGLNALPIPGLDGGMALLLFLANWGWELSPAAEARLCRRGMAAATVLSIVPAAALAIGGCL